MLFAMTDQATLDWYDREAAAYAAMMGSARALSFRFLEPFLAALPPGAHVLELGCGGGRDTLVMLERGFSVDATDGSSGMAQEASARIGQPVRVLRFTDLDAQGTYDAVWAHASIHHQPYAGLADVLARIRRALKPGGLFFTNFKLGTGDDRDSLGRLYAFPPRDDLLALYAATGWDMISTEDYRAGGADKVERDWIAITARKPA